MRLCRFSCERERSKENIKNFLFYQFSGEVEAGNVIINGDNLADVFLLEIISQLKALRNKANGGIE